MTPAEVIRRLLPSAKWGNPEWAEVLKVLADDGLVVISADLLADIDKAFTNLGVCTDHDCCQPVCGWVRPELVHRLRAALPERPEPAPSPGRTTDELRG